MTAVISLKGRVFGRLTVLRQVPGKPGRTMWLCRCTCGGRKAVRGTHLKGGKTRSCGCAHHLTNADRWFFGELRPRKPKPERTVSCQ